jgi:hypothetical protein
MGTETPFVDIQVRGRTRSGFTRTRSKTCPAGRDIAITCATAFRLRARQHRAAGGAVQLRRIFDYREAVTRRLMAE